MGSSTIRDSNPIHKFKVTCKGSLQLGTACLKCTKCKEELVLIFRGMGKEQQKLMLIKSNMDNNLEKSMTLGEIRVARSFNPSANEVVEDFKARFAALIDDLEALRQVAPDNREKQRTISNAQARAEEACMYAVKSVFQ